MKKIFKLADSTIDNALLAFHSASTTRKRNGEISIFLSLSLSGRDARLRRWNRAADGETSLGHFLSSSIPTDEVGWRVKTTTVSPYLSSTFDQLNWTSAHKNAFSSQSISTKVALWTDGKVLLFVVVVCLFVEWMDGRERERRVVRVWWFMHELFSRGEDVQLEFQ